jgi:formate dehydrogenase subunit beta
MTAFSLLQGAGGELASLRDFLARLLQSGLAEAVLVPAETQSGRAAIPALIRDPEQLEIANPLLPVLGISGARMLSLLTRRGRDQRGAPIAAVLRPCELRSLVELSKLNQVNMSRLLTIGLDCGGTVEGNELAGEPDPDAMTRSVLASARQAKSRSPAGVRYRSACEICASPVPWRADISLHLIGVPAEDGILVEVAEDGLLEPLGLDGAADPARHQEAAQELLATRLAVRSEKLAAFEAQMAANGVPEIAVSFESCQRCLNCTVACPICYCKECLFRTDVFDHEPDTYLGWAERKGAARLPGDAISFQLTRLLHVAISCVGCGLCTSACPAGLPVDTLFQAVARRTQALFNYVPGRDSAEPLPTAAFKVDEFETLGNS